MRYTASERTLNADIKELHNEIEAMTKTIKKLNEDKQNLIKHIELKDECIQEQRFKINALETLMENWSKYNEKQD